MDNIHSKGNLYDPADLVKVVTGEGLDHRAIPAYLNEKVDRTYGA